MGHAAIAALRLCNRVRSENDRMRWVPQPRAFCAACPAAQIRLPSPGLAPSSFAEQCRDCVPAAVQYTSVNTILATAPRDYVRALGTPVRLSYRGAQLSVLLGIHALLLPLVLAVHTRRDNAIARALEESYYAMLRASLRMAGGALPKIGQWAATRPDVVPPRLAAALAALQSHAVRPADVRTVLCVLERDLGAGVVLWIDDRPAGSGTVAQVHRAIVCARSATQRSFLVPRRRTGIFTPRCAPCTCDCLSSGSESAATNGCGRTVSLPTVKGADEPNRHARHPHWHVALKVRHTNSAEEISDDTMILRGLARLVSAVLPSSLRWLRLGREADAFSAMMAAQLDMRAEARILARFCWAFGPWRRNVAFPRPMPALCTERVLVESDVTGIPLAAFFDPNSCDSGSQSENCRNHVTPLVPGRADGSADERRCRARMREIREDLAATGVRVFLRMLLWANLVHADMHPGNLFVCLEDKGADLTSRVLEQTGDAGDVVGAVERVLVEHPGARAKLVVLDAGLATSLRRADARNLRDLFRALFLPGGGGGREVSRLLMERTSDPSWVPYVRDARGFASSLDDLVRTALHPHERASPIIESATTIARLRAGPILARVFGLARAHRVHLESGYANIVASFVCVEGIGRQLAPDLPLLPLLARAALPGYSSVARMLRNHGVHCPLS